MLEVIHLFADVVRSVGVCKITSGLLCFAAMKGEVIDGLRSVAAKRAGITLGEQGLVR